MVLMPAVRRSGPIRGRARPVPAVAVLCVLLATGCGTSQRDQDAGDVAARFVTAVSNGDVAAACGLLSQRTNEELATGGSDCEQELTSTEVPVSSVDGVTVWGDRAQVHTGSGTLFLAEFDDGWKVVAAGCTPRGEDLPYRCAVGGT